LPSFRILLDECIDRRLAREISGHVVKTAPEMGWAGLDNGELLAKAQKEFDVFVTVDRNLTFQQHLPKFDVAVLVLCARTNRLQDLIPLALKILDALTDPQRGKAVFIHS
jgi:hypothetical protein